MHIARNFAAVGRMTDVDRIPQIEMFDDSRRIRSIMVHVVPRGDPCRTARTATIMRDDAIVIGQETQHLRIPIIRRQRPAVMEHNRLRVL